MTNDVSKLREQYRQVRAPAGLAVRVRAATNKPSVRGSLWMPTTAAVLALAMLAVVVPLLVDVENDVPAATEKPPVPSLSMLASMLPEKPSGRAASLTQLRTLAKPKMPSKPAGNEPQASQPNHDKFLKEKNHALI